MEHNDVEQTLSEVERVRHSTRRALHPIWYSNLVAGIFFLGAALVSGVVTEGWLGLAYWVIGGFLGLGLITRYYMKTERAVGAESRSWDAAASIALAIVAAVVGVSLLTDGELGAIAPLYPAAAGTIALGLVLRDPIEAAAGLAIAVIATAILVLGPGEPWVWGNLGLGLTLVVAGVVGRTRGQESGNAFLTRGSGAGA